MEKRSILIKRLAMLKKDYSVLKSFKSGSDVISVEDALIENISKLRNTFAFVYACGFVRAFAEDYYEAMSVVRSHFSNAGLEHVPLFRFLVVKGENKKEVVVEYFPNIIINTTFPIENYICCSPETHYEWDKEEEVLSKFATDYFSDMNNERNAVRWSENKRIRQRIKNRITCSIPVFLKKIVGSTHNDSTIRDVSYLITSKYCPPELHFAQEKQEYFDMYETPGCDFGSCMAFWERRGPTAHALKNKGFHPSHFYHHLHPYTQGVYLKANGKILARCIVFHTPEANYYGRIFALNHTYATILKDRLTKHEKNYMSVQEVNPRVSFIPKGGVKIPGYEHEGAYYAPISYVDYAENRFTWEYNKETHIFTVHSYEVTKRLVDGSKFQMIEGNQNGLVSSLQFETMQCAHCKDLFTALRNPDFVSTLDNKFFCHPSHAKHAHYIPVIEGTGYERWVHGGTEGLYTDRFTGTVYSNKQAAISCGAVPVLPTSDVILEDPDTEEVSTYNVTEIKGKFYSLTQPQTHSIKTNPLDLSKRLQIQVIQDMVLDLETMEVVKR